MRQTDADREAAKPFRRGVTAFTSASKRRTNPGPHLNNAKQIISSPPRSYGAKASVAKSEARLRLMANGTEKTRVDGSHSAAAENVRGSHFAHSIPSAKTDLDGPKSEPKSTSKDIDVLLDAASLDGPNEASFLTAKEESRVWDAGCDTENEYLRRQITALRSVVAALTEEITVTREQHSTALQEGGNPVRALSEFCKDDETAEIQDGKQPNGINGTQQDGRRQGHEVVQLLAGQSNRESSQVLDLFSENMFRTRSRCLVRIVLLCWGTWAKVRQSQRSPVPVTSPRDETKCHQDVGTAAIKFTQDEKSSHEMDICHSTQKIVSNHRVSCVLQDHHLVAVGFTNGGREKELAARTMEQPEGVSNEREPDTDVATRTDIPASNVKACWHNVPPGAHRQLCNTEQNLGGSVDRGGSPLKTHGYAHANASAIPVRSVHVIGHSISEDQHAHCDDHHCDLRVVDHARGETSERVPVASIEAVQERVRALQDSIRQQLQSGAGSDRLLSQSSLDAKVHEESLAAQLEGMVESAGWANQFHSLCLSAATPRDHSQLALGEHSRPSAHLDRTQASQTQITGTAPRADGQSRQSRFPEDRGCHAGSDGRGGPRRRRRRSSSSSSIVAAYPQPFSLGAAHAPSQAQASSHAGWTEDSDAVTRQAVHGSTHWQAALPVTCAFSPGVSESDPASAHPPSRVGQSTRNQDQDHDAGSGDVRTAASTRLIGPGELSALLDFAPRSRAPPRRLCSDPAPLHSLPLPVPGRGLPGAQV